MRIDLRVPSVAVVLVLAAASARAENDPVAVRHFVDAATRLGLWASEEAVLTRVFDPEQTLLECGCGAGRSS